MSYQHDREAFVAACTAEGLALADVRAILRAAATIQRCAELACSSEAADRDRVPCPDRDPAACLCSLYGSQPSRIDDEEPQHHGTVPRHMLRDRAAERRIEAVCRKYAGVVPVFSGDPRGACVKLQVPSGRTDDWGRTGLCVPTR